MHQVCSYCYTFSGNLAQLRTICNFQISIDNQNIVKVKETNFLGVILDANINWKSEISRVANKVVKSICEPYSPQGSELLWRGLTDSASSYGYECNLDLKGP